MVVNGRLVPPAATASAALPRLASGTYTAVWAAERLNGHTTTGSVRFMVD
ncbi:MAG: copper resistance protein CopC [Brevundimonas sp.]|nr:copper resistance protein CopC [Pseudomonadota bacterium]